MATTIDERLLKRLLPIRTVGAHKWGVGGTLIIAGSPSYPGAAWLASRSAGRSGAGIVYLATPRGVIAAMASAMPEVAFVPLPDTDAPGVARRAVERLAEVLPKVRSVVIGPGLGNDESTAHLLGALLGIGEAARAARSIPGFGVGRDSPPERVGTIFEITDAQIVLDADALNWLASQHSWWTHVPAHRLVLTPHPGEAERLSGKPAEDFVENPVDTAQELASTWQQTVVMKTGYAAASDGNNTITCDIAPTSLATAGTGDCLAGAIGAYLAQGCSPLDAAALGLGIGARAAVAAEARFGAAGVLASDLPEIMAQCTQELS